MSAQASRLLLGLGLIAAFVLGGCGGGGDNGVPEGAPKEASDFAKEWPAPNGDLANRRVASSDIDSGNVDQLGVAWTVPITERSQVHPDDFEVGDVKVDDFVAVIRRPDGTVRWIYVLSVPFPPAP